MMKKDDFIRKCGYCKKPVHVDEAWIKEKRTDRYPYMHKIYYHKECYEKANTRGIPQGV
ncbi:MAG: hypothetical protein ACFFG0_02265 [Candidatus Thorarchaeota archaeon]